MQSRFKGLTNSTVLTLSILGVSATSAMALAFYKWNKPMPRKTVDASIDSLVVINEKGLVIFQCMKNNKPTGMSYAYYGKSCREFMNQFEVDERIVLKLSNGILEFVQKPDLKNPPRFAVDKKATQVESKSEEVVVAAAAAANDSPRSKPQPVIIVHHHQKKSPGLTIEQKSLFMKTMGRKKVSESKEAEKAAGSVFKL